MPLALILAAAAQIAAAAPVPDPCQAAGPQPAPLPATVAMLPVDAIADVGLGTLRIARRRGIEVRSHDPRIRDLRMRADTSIVDHCLAEVSVPSPWTASAGPSTIGIGRRRSTPDLSPGASPNRLRGTVPTLAGYRLAASWPLLDRIVALMRPVDGRAETLIVVFAATGRAAAVVPVLRMPWRMQGIAVVPDLHAPQSALYVDGIDDGVIRRTILTIDHRP